MKISITKKHEYLSGWTAYDMTWKTDYTGVRKNMTLQSVVWVSNEPFSSKTIKAWASELGYDLDALFTVLDNSKEDCEKMNKLIKVLNKESEKNYEGLNNNNKCLVHYSATLNPNYRPLKTAFETIEAYNVKVYVEYKSGYFEMVFPSQGRKKSESCPMIMLSGPHMGKSIGEEDEAIEKISSHIERYINDCDSIEKFKELPKKLAEVKVQLMKYYK